MRWASNSPDDCDLDTVSNVRSASRVGWTPDGIALFADSTLPPHWIGVDPATRVPVDRKVDSAIVVSWNRRAVADFVPTIVEMPSPGGAYTFLARHDSIVVRGPDRQGAMSARFVGAGIPVTSTRNGEYLLAVRRGVRGPETVVYYFQLHHAMMRTSCDR